MKTNPKILLWAVAAGTSLLFAACETTETRSTQTTETTTVHTPEGTQTTTVRSPVRTETYEVHHD